MTPEFESIIHLHVVPFTVGADGPDHIFLCGCVRPREEISSSYLKYLDCWSGRREVELFNQLLNGEGFYYEHGSIACPQCASHPSLEDIRIIHALHFVTGYEKG